MPTGLVRLHQTGDLHFVTFSCHKRKPYLESPEVRDLVERSLEKMRKRYGFSIHGFVVMPEHVHLLMTEPEQAKLSTAIQAIKLSVTVRRQERPFWYPRSYDFNVFTHKKRIEKLRYMHRNPVTRGLVSAPEDWRWSSFHHYWTGQQSVVAIMQEWTPPTLR